MSAPVDVLAVLGRHVALAEQVGCREQQAEAHALFDAIAKAIECMRSSPCFCVDADDDGDAVTCDRCAALRAVGGVE